MSRRRKPYGYTLEPLPRQMPLLDEEIGLVLRAADELINLGGRSLLVKILKGSREQSILRHNLQHCPVYGVWKNRATEDVAAIVDRAVVAGFLRIQYSGQLPVLVFTEIGWEWERGQRVEEFLREWDVWIDTNTPPASMEYLKDRNRVMIQDFLERVRSTGESRYIPLLERWAEVDHKKVRALIADVVKDLKRANR